MSGYTHRLGKVGGIEGSFFDADKYKRMIGVYIREQRESLCIDLKELSRRSSIPASRLKKIEKGEVLVREKTLDRLRLYLDLEESHLERIQEVAHMAYIDELQRVISEVPPATSFPDKDGHA